MRRMLSLCNIPFNIRRLFGKAGFIPILNNRFDDMSKMKTVVEGWRSSHHLDDYWCLDWAVHPRRSNKWWSSGRTWRSTDMRGPLPCIGHMGRGIRCLRFRSDPERTYKWMYVWHRISFCVIDKHRLHSVNCLCGMLRCKWSRLLLKNRVLWLMIKAQL